MTTSSFQHRRCLTATPGAVFAAIADPARLARWWGPAGFTNTFQAFTFQTGGRWTFTMHGPDGQDYANEAVFAEIVPDARVRIRHTCPPLFDLTITLHATPAGTEVSWVQQFDDPAVAAAVRHIVEPANEQNLDRLAAELARSAPATGR